MLLRLPRGFVRRPLLVLMAVLVALPAAADQEVTCYQTALDADGNPAGPSYCTQQVWFTDTGTKAGNLAGTGGADFPTWDTSEPTTSVTGGAGGGYFTNGVPRQFASDPETDPLAAAVFEGSFTGELDNMVVELYMFAPATAAADPPGAYVGSVELDIDGEKVLVPTQVNLQLEPGGDAVSKTSFAITDLQEGLSYAGVATGPDVEHNVRLLFSAFGAASATAVIVYDTTEVPAGITFNQPVLDEGLVTVAAG